MERNVDLGKLMKKGKGLLIAGIVLMVMALSSLAFGFFEMNEEKKNPANFLNASKEGEVGAINVTLVTSAFAVPEDENDDEKVYMVYDEENYMYLVSMRDVEFEKLKDIYEYTYNEEIEEAPEPVKLIGTATKVPSDLKKLAIDYYNEIFTDAKLTSSNFANQFGDYYLDTTKTPAGDNFIFCAMSAGLLTIVAICLIIGFFNNRKDSKKSLAKFEGNLEKLEKELNNSSTMDYKKYKLFLTDNYIVTYASGLKVVDYKDIVWLYPKEVTYRGSTTRTVYVVTNDSKMNTVCNMGLTKKTRPEMDEIYQAVLLKLPKDALAGYTNENRLKVKDLYTKKDK